MITGASSGIGKGLALEIASRGGHLGLLAQQEGLLNEIATEAQARNVKAIAATADVRDAAAVREAADCFGKELGPIDVLIANAGIGTANHALQLAPNHAAEVIGINVLGAVNSVAAVAPQMVERGQGRLVGLRAGRLSWTAQVCRVLCEQRTHFAHRVDHVYRQADRAALVGDRPGDGLANPPRGIRRNL